MVVAWSMVVVVMSWFVVPVGLQVPSCLRPPVEAPVVDPFREPGCAWCPGNRGLTYGVAPGVVVRAAAAGTVSFAGVVAGTRYVVVDHADDDLRATYGGLATSPLGVGDAVVAGGPVGVAAGDVHFGLRRGEAYVDPAPLLGRLVERPRLVPTDGTARRPAPAARLTCDGAGASGRSSPADSSAGRSGAAAGAALPVEGVRQRAWREPHHGYPAIDVIVPAGTVVRAWRGGTVRNVHANARNCADTAAGSRCREPCGIGITVVDDTWPDVTWTYCHLSARDVDAGDALVVGQPVGRSGNTGRSGVPHLHLEVRVGGSRVCPQPALESIAGGGAMPDAHSLPTHGCSF